MDITRIDNLFFSSLIENGRAKLLSDEMRHAFVVLRMGKGDAMFLTDGKGAIYRGQVNEIGKNETVVEILEMQALPRPVNKISMAIAPTKNFSRMEWCIEKLTEMGVHRIIPMLCERSERTKWNAARARKVAISALKQSKQVWLPELENPLQFDEVVKTGSAQTRYIAVAGEQSIAAVKHYQRRSDVLMLIGPEGDFTKRETDIALDAGFVPLSLGDIRLRTETAAIVAMATIKALNQ